MSPQSIGDDYGGGDARGPEDYSVGAFSLSMFYVPGESRGLRPDKSRGLREKSTWVPGESHRLMQKKGLGEQAQLPWSIFTADLNRFTII